MQTELKLDEMIVKRIEDLCKKENRIRNKKVTPYTISKNGEFNPRTLNHILSGYAKDPRISTINKICKGLNMSLFDFFNDDIFK